MWARKTKFNEQLNSNGHLNFQNQVIFCAHTMCVCVCVMCYSGKKTSCNFNFAWEYMKRAMMAKSSIQMIIIHDTYDVGCSTWRFLYGSYSSFSEFPVFTSRLFSVNSIVWCGFTSFLLVGFFFQFRSIFGMEWRKYNKWILCALIFRSGNSAMELYQIQTFLFSSLHTMSTRDGNFIASIPPWQIFKHAVEHKTFSLKLCWSVFIFDRW